MRIHVSNLECSGHGQCALVNEELFPLDDDGFSAVTADPEVPADLADDARSGVDACPSRAISLLEP
jgi:ferredoxin